MNKIDDDSLRNDILKFEDFKDFLELNFDENYDVSAGTDVNMNPLNFKSAKKSNSIPLSDKDLNCSTSHKVFKYKNVLVIINV